VQLDALPLTPTGKVDRGALPRPEAPTARGHEAPRTPIEEQLVEIWKAVLGVPEVGIHDGFFELGGHSLLATQVVSRVRDAMGVQLALRALFDAPTVAELALVVLGELAAGEDAGALAGILEEVQRAGESSPTADGADGGGERA
jgi:acyl carrier protein